MKMLNSFKILLSIVVCCVFFYGCAVNSVISRSYDFKKMNKIAIMRVKSQDKNLKMTKDIFARELLKQDFTVVERSRIRQILKEQKLSEEFSLAPKNTRLIGKLLGVDTLLMGDVAHYASEERKTDAVETEDVYVEPIYSIQSSKMPDGKYKQVIAQTGRKIRRETRKSPDTYRTSPKVGVTARIVDVETAEIVWVGSVIKSGNTSMDAAEKCVVYLMNNFKKDLKKNLKKR
ncbi:CsgG/HfaB family protein [Elusimicrobiota bacterium]